MTGAAGFLGTAVGAELARQGARVVGLDLRARPIHAADAGPWVQGDVRDGSLVRSTLQAHEIDTVLHLAAQALVGAALEDPRPTFDHNVRGTWEVLDACRDSPGVRRVLVTSSDKAYGDWAGRVYREEMALRPGHPYDASKAAADLVAQAYGATYRLPVAISRCGNLYGGGDLHWSRIVPGTIRSLLRREQPIIRSDGTLVRDYLHVSDAVAGVLLLADAVGEDPALAGRAFNFAAGSRHSVIDLVRAICRLTGVDLAPIVEGGGETEIRAQRLSTRRARTELGWRPRMRLEAGLREAIAWYRTYFAGYG